MKFRARWLLAAVLGLAPALAVQGAPEVVMDNSKVTESAVIDALAVDEPQTAVGATRGFRPANPNAASPAPRTSPAPAAGPGRANLLITFLTGSSTLTPESQAALDKVAAALQSDRLAGLTFRVEGHADARGNAQDNLRLSQQRAESVVTYLVSKHSILPERLTALGKGSSEPLNSERVDAPENRRVTLVTNRS